MNAILQLFRPLTSFMVALAVFVSAIVGVGLNITIYLPTVIIAMIVAFFFASAGNALNDYLDRDIDLVNHPNRPIPSGKIKPNQTLLLSIIIFIIIIILAWFINVICFLIVIIALFFQLTYEKVLKSKGLAGNLTISTQTALVFVFGGAAVSQMVVPGILGFLAFFAILGREIVKDIEDIKGDVNRFTLPMKIGVKNASIIATIFLILAIIMSPLPYYPLNVFSLWYIPFITIANIILISSIPFIFNNPRLASTILKAGMIMVMISFILGKIIWI